MRVWLKYREASNGIKSDWDFELINLADALDEHLDMGDGWEQVGEEDVEKALLWWLNDHHACIWGDRWSGGTFEYTLVDKPPESWYVQEWRRAMERRVNAEIEERETAQALFDNYSNGRTLR